jgi:zinc resistance-associated protein
MKRWLIALGILLLVGFIAYPVMARGPWGWDHHPRGYGGGGPGSCWDRGADNENLTDEQKTQLDNLHKAFYEETSPLRDRLWTKHAELNEVMNAPTPDADKAMSIQREINDLRAKMAEARIKFELEARKINPDDRYGKRWGKGYGRHMKRFGYGPGMRGYGPGMGGEGQGSCWN